VATRTNRGSAFSGLRSPTKDTTEVPTVTNSQQGLQKFTHLKFTGWWFEIFLGIFTPKIGGDDSQFDEHIFQMGWFNHQLVEQFAPEKLPRPKRKVVTTTSNFEGLR